MTGVVGAPAAVVSHSFWQHECSGDPGVGPKAHALPITNLKSSELPPDFFGLEVDARLTSRYRFVLTQ